MVLSCSRYRLAPRVMKVGVMTTFTAWFVYSSTCSTSNSERNLFSRSAPGNETLVKVFSYNLLSSSLAAPSHFPKCDPQDLASPARLVRIKDKLGEPVARRSILGLQEVSHDWANGLYPYLLENGYAFVPGLYGKAFNNYMGVALAWPTDTYTALEVRIERLVDTCAWPKTQNNKQVTDSSSSRSSSSSSSSDRGWLEWVVPARWLKSSKPPREPFDPIAVAQNRQNKIVMARLQDKKTKRTFWVATYHMPCMFGSAEKRQVMVIHAALAAQYIQNEAKKTGDEYILMGDFNFQPTDSCYTLMTEGQLSVEHEDFPVAFQKDPSSWNPNNLKAMNSAYKLHLGEEPPYTNNAVVAWRDKINPPFVATLDYIFCSKGWTVEHVLDTPSRIEADKGPLPNAEEPSDHIMIGAELKL